MCHGCPGLFMRFLTDSDSAHCECGIEIEHRPNEGQLQTITVGCFGMRNAESPESFMAEYGAWQV